MISIERLKPIVSITLLYVCATGAGWAFSRIGLPLPWMIGPLILSALCYVTGIMKTRVPVETRPFGQMTVAVQVGLAFTPAAFGALLTLAPLLVGMALVTAVCASVVAILMARVGRIRLTQAFLSSFPTSPVEAAVMAEKFDCDPAPIILSQTMRIAAVVVLIPISLFIVDGFPDRSEVMRGGVFDPVGNGILALTAIAGAFVFRKLRLANPFFLGPLAFSAAVTASGFELMAFPGLILSIAQIVLGTWLGSTFRRELFLDGGRLVITCLSSALLLLAVVSAIAVGVSSLTGQDWEVLVLGAAPGGVTEMALTAKYLGIDLALVTAFQLTRIFILMPNIPWIIRLINRLENRYLS